MMLTHCGNNVRNRYSGCVFSVKDIVPVPLKTSRNHSFASNRLIIKWLWRFGKGNLWSEAQNDPRSCGSNWSLHSIVGPDVIFLFRCPVRPARSAVRHLRQSRPML